MHINLAHGALHYTVSGEGAPVILLHGWGVDSKSFTPVHKFLERNFKVYAVDFPGFGQSDEPPEQWGVEDYTEVLAQFIDELEIENPILVGHSFGGRVSIVYASKYKKAKKLILAGSAGIKPKRKLNYYAKVYFYKACKNVLRLPGLNKYREDILAKIKGRTGSADYRQASGVMQQTMVKVVNEDLQHLMPDVKVPVLLIYGENDTATPVADGRRMEELMPDAGLVVLKNAGHYVFLDQMNQFNVIVDKFLEKDKGATK
ncbi:alpha/beta hydrolase [Alteribacter lacisalsi]|uniref:Alpha/beta hydrolase n=1 Tax=Alteribacter lacisalsi TaxID=2045244 RepID=A0A2W0HH54_9BACI|nr:alpha/beta hydrolase [Alteribacter lacisalsi]PYZ96755.1 alpha/beta hydrolase [Alteribacter lacisalsi]